MSSTDKIREKFEKQLAEFAERKDEIEEKALEAISMAKIKIMKQSPFFASLLFKLPAIPNYSIPTMGTDGLILLYNPTFTANLKRKDVVFVLLHEIEHIVFKHHMRCPVNMKSAQSLHDMYNQNEIKDPFLKAQLEEISHILEKWNIATDHAINLNIKYNIKIEPTEFLVRDVGIKMDDKWRETPSEVIFKNLKDCDSGNQAENMGVGAVYPVGFGELDPIEIKDAEKELESNVHAAAAMARKAGKLPGGMEKVINDLYTTTTPWQDIMRTQISTIVSKMNYTWSRPNKRYAQHLADFGVIMPGLYGEEYADMYFVMDTSGSVSDDDRAILVSELKRILEDYRVRIHLIYCDTEVKGTPIVLTQEDIQDGKLELKLKGYGGTDFRPAFEYITEHLDEVPTDMVIYLTDMEPNTWHLGPEPPYSVYWAVLPHGDQSAEPPWGVKIQIELEK